MRALRAVFLLNGAALGVFYPFISVILADRDVPPAWIGIVMAASSAAFTIAVPAWGHIADVILGRRRALAVSALGAAVFVLLAGAPVEVVVVALALVGFSVFESAWGPLGDALAVNAIKDHGRDYARIRLLSSVGFGVVSALAGILYNTTGYGPSFVLCALLAVLLALAALRAPDLARADLATVARGHTRGGSFMVALRIQPRLGPVLLAILLIHVGVIAGFTYLPLRLIELGGGPSDVALNAAVSAFAEIPAMLLTGAVAARIGIRGLVAGSAFLYAACFLSWTVLDVPMLIVATRVVTGFAFAGLWVGSVLTMAVLLPPRLQGTGQGLYQVTAFGVAAVIANIAGGFIFGELGSAVLFGIAAVLAVAAGLLVFLVFPRRGERVAREEDEVVAAAISGDARVARARPATTRSARRPFASCFSDKRHLPAARGARRLGPTPGPPAGVSIVARAAPGVADARRRSHGGHRRPDLRCHPPSRRWLLPPREYLRDRPARAQLGHDLADRRHWAGSGGRRESGSVTIRLGQGLTPWAGDARPAHRCRVRPAGDYALSSSSVAMVDCRISADRRRPDASSAESPRRSVRSTPPRPSTVGTDR